MAHNFYSPDFNFVDDCFILRVADLSMIKHDRENKKVSRHFLHTVNVNRSKIPPCIQHYFKLPQICHVHKF